jgi:hypothetical protein
LTSPILDPIVKRLEQWGCSLFVGLAVAEHDPENVHAAVDGEYGLAVTFAFSP